MGQKVLVISNNVFSTTYNNGKTIYSLIQALPSREVAQLYFNSSPPEVPGYNYFQISDKNILRGQLRPSQRGDKVEAVKDQVDRNIFTPSSRIPRNNLTLLLREILWKKSWKSKQLNEWLDEVAPERVFFVAGDCLFAYRICTYIVNKYHSKLNVYVTDDYVLPREKEDLFGKYRRKKIFEMMMKCLKKSSQFFTISERMRHEYKKLYGKDSICVFNVTESMRDRQLCEISDKNTSIVLTYAGSLYYGRDDVLWMLAQAIEKYNTKYLNSKRVQLCICSSSSLNKDFFMKLKTLESVNFLGSLNQEQLKEKLNLSNILVYVESFIPAQIEKTRLSLSTKIPEYLAIGKPVLAIGPQNIGSMDYLADAAICITEEMDIYYKLEKLLGSKEMQREYSKKALDKYEKSYEKWVQYQKMLL